MIPMRKISHTWFLLAILFTLDYSGVKMQADVPLPSGVDHLRFDMHDDSRFTWKDCEEELIYE